MSRAYGLALLFESVALFVFVIVALNVRKDHAMVLDAEAAILCFAMGMQNSLVTNLSGAVIRTTHLTGVVTDLGIEAARWHYWLFSRYRGALGLRPSPTKALLLLTILTAFTAGAISGALFTARRGPKAMLLPSAALLLAAAYAFVGKSRPRPAPQPDMRDSLRDDR